MKKDISFAHFNTIFIFQTPSILSTFVERGDNEDEILVQPKLTISIVASDVNFCRLHDLNLSNDLF